MLEIFSRKLEDESLRKIENPVKNSWINAVKPKKKEREFLTKELKIPPEFIISALDEKERPRIEREGNCLLVIFRVPLEVKDEGIHKKETVAVGIIIAPEHIITVSSKETKVLQDFKSEVIRFHTSMRVRFLLQILSRINYYYIKYLDEIEEDIESIEKGLLTYVKNADIIRLFGIQKTLTYFNTSITANGNVLERMLGGNYVDIREEDKEFLDDIIIENKQAESTVNVYNNILSSTLDAYASVVSNNLNLVVKILTIITVILSFPVMIASFYGMNVALPFQRSPFAFWYTIIISAVIGLAFMFLFRRKRWI